MRPLHANMQYLREEFEEGQDGGGHISPIESLYNDNPSVEEHVDEDGEGTVVEDDAGGGTEGTPSGGGTMVDYDKLAQSMATALARVVPQGQQQQQQAAPAMSEAEFRKATNYFEVQEQMLDVLFNQDLTKKERAAALQQMLDGMATHAMSVARFYVDNRLQQGLAGVESKIQPLTERQMNEARGAWVDNFCKSTTGFEKAKPVVNMVIDYLMKSGYKPQGEEKDKQVVLTMATDIIKASNPNFSATGQTARNGGGRSARGNMPGVTNGSGGSGAGGGHKKQMSAAANLYLRK